MGLIDKRLAELGIVLPTPAKPIANYVPWVRTGNLVYISGQGAMKDGKLEYTGRVGDTLSIDDAIASARLTAINIIVHVRDACGGDLDRVKRVVRLGGFIACTPEFTQHALVMNGASDLMVAVLGDKGRHTRAAVGVSGLPVGAAVEVDAIFSVT